LHAGAVRTQADHYPRSKCSKNRVQILHEIGPTRSHLAALRMASQPGRSFVDGDFDDVSIYGSTGRKRGNSHLFPKHEGTGSKGHEHAPSSMSLIAWS
jgi:hypothetical protein